MIYFYTVLISIIFCLLGYLLGNILFGEILTKFNKIDIRHTGSGNIGGTNVSRVNKKLGFLVTFLDGLKAYIAVVLCWAIFIGSIKQFFNLQGISPLYTLVYLGGLFAILGHCYPLKYIVCLIKNKTHNQQTKAVSGGKGVSCIMGLFFAYNFLIGLLAMEIWFVTLFICRYVSLSSIISVLLCPFFVFIKWIQFPYLFVNAIFGNSFITFANVSYTNCISFLLIVFIILILGSSIIVVRHKPNIERLITHTEPKIKK